MDTQMITAVPVDRLVAAHGQLRDQLKTGLTMIYEAITTATDVFEPGDLYSFGGSSDYGTWLHCVASDVRVRMTGQRLDAIDKTVDQFAWRILMDKSGMMLYMSADARRKWRDQIEAGDVPNFSHENIAATFADLIENQASRMDDMVVSVFRGLSWHYKSNSPVRFDRRTIVNCYSIDRIDDLQRACAILAGEPVPVAEQLLTRSVPFRSTWEIEVPHMRVRKFKKGTVHVFLDDPSIDALNAVIGRLYPGQLPAPRGPRGGATKTTSSTPSVDQVVS